MNLYQPTITGSLSVSGSINISGSINVVGSGGTITGTASYASNAELLDGLDSTVFTLTSSFAAQTASFTAFTASILSYTSSQNILNGKYATTSSNTFTGIQTVNSNLVVTGSITAQTLVVQTVTSSVVYSSGSNVFGNNIANTQVLTGSVTVTGSLAVVTTGTEFQVTSTGVNLGNALTDSHVISGSLRVNPNGLFVSSSGLVGIGNVVPAYTLDVSGTGRFTSTLLVSGASTFGDSVTITAGNSYANYALKVNNAAGAEKLRLDGNGNLLVGYTTDQGYKFGVNGTSIFASAALFQSNVSVNGTAIATSGILTVKTDTSSIGATTALGLLISNDGGIGKMAQIGFGYSESKSGAVIGGIITNGGGSTSSALFFATRDTTDGATAPTERMRITSGGDLYVGNTSFTSPNGADRFIGVYGGQDCSLILQDAVQTWELYVNDDFYINRGSTNVLTALRSNGNVGIGVTPVTKLDVVANSDATALTLRMRSTDDYSFLQFRNNAGTQVISEIYSNRTADNTGSLIFTTNNGGSATERMRITSGGNVGIGASGTANTAVLLSLAGQDSTSSNYLINGYNLAGTTLFAVRNDGVIFTGTASRSPVNDLNGAAANLIVVAGGNLQKSTASSGRYKENITDWSGNGLETILALKPKTFTYKESYYKYSEVVMLGLIAEEVAEVSEYLADFENQDRTGQVENVRYANIVVPLIKAIQEQQTLITALQEKLQRNNIN